MGKVSATFGYFKGVLEYSPPTYDPINVPAFNIRGNREKALDSFVESEISALDISTAKLEA